MGFEAINQNLYKLKLNKSVLETNRKEAFSNLSEEG